MIIVDTSVFVDFLRDGDPAVEAALDRGRVLIHPFVIGEIALGHLKKRRAILDLLAALPRAQPATDSEALAYIERHCLFGRGIGFVDAHLLASARLSSAALWTRDKKLRAVAEEMALAAADI
ncbi:MAG: type II toxin-antitoxin system VapC family toxin [Parvularculaceae bacterium]|nr:type II toxin-antitoxin system VapC family toxin [Parvularculaceae bacterium]